MRDKISHILWATLFFILSFAVITAHAADIAKITPEETLSRLDSALIVDARSGADWSGSTLKIKGAMRGSLQDVDTWAAAIPRDREIIVYCA
ncbi:MAG: hypothetical protein ACK5JO_10000 [Halodesulfovibrio sp.]